jgi:aminopeptidase N
VFRSVVYNKGALVLHMLRRFVGEEVFVRGLQRFYGVSRFRRVGTDDLRTAFEVESGRSLESFFERWVYETGIPTLRTSWGVEDPTSTSGGALAGASAVAGVGPVLTVRVEQDGPEFHVVPLTVTIVYADGRTESALAQVEHATTVLAIPVTGAVRDVRFNDDYAALARVERARR